MNAAAVRTSPVGIFIPREYKTDQAQVNVVLVKANTAPEPTQQLACPQRMVDRFPTQVTGQLAEAQGQV